MTVLSEPMTEQVTERLRRDSTRPAPVRLVPTEMAELERPQYLGHRPRSRTVSLVVRASIPLLLLLAWWYGSASGLISPTVLASPRDVVR
ncbi:MAG TPA: hypothetical protein VIM14_04935, partial [Polyangia bacterium]